MRRLSLIISCLLLIVAILPTNAQPLTTLNAPSPPPLDYLAEGASACFVYPIVVGYGSQAITPTPMPDPTVAAIDVPSVSRFTVNQFNSTQPFFLWLTWKYLRSSVDLQRALTSGGTLGEGFQESSYPYDGSKNSVLEKGDSLGITSGNSNFLIDKLSQLIISRQIMILPFTKVVIPTGTNYYATVDSFIAVRLLNYNFVGTNKYLELGLVANDVQYACFKSQTDQSMVQFRNTMPLSDVVQLHWDFGDGTSTTGISPTHRYDSTGTFTVTLSITDTLNRPSYAYGRVNITELTPISRTLFLPLIQHYGVNGVPEGTP